MRELKDMVCDYLQKAGFVLKDDLICPPAEDKDVVRRLHIPATRQEIAARKDWLQRYLPKYLPYFADGREIDPGRITPALVEVQTPEQHDLFRVARLLWSLPFSKGFGRRLRFLIMDQAHEKLIGILALQSPPLSFPARDRLFQYPPGQKTALVNQTMDVQTLGSVPPYSQLLGGKLVAMAAASNEIRDAYRRRYADCTTLMEGRAIPPHLVALTTTSAFGRSSLYNRLRYHDISIADSIGYTDGYGIFHLQELYPHLRTFLESRGVSTKGGFGTGPRRKWQIITRALERLGFSSEILRHGVKREVFLFRLTDNLEAYMAGRETQPAYRDLPFAALAAWWRKRWLLPRAARVEWQSWQKVEIMRQLLPDS